MKRRKAVTIIRLLMQLLKSRPLSLRALEKKVNTNQKTVRDCIELLTELGIVELRVERIGRSKVSRVELTAVGSRARV